MRSILVGAGVGYRVGLAVYLDTVGVLVGVIETEGAIVGAFDDMKNDENFWKSTEPKPVTGSHLDFAAGIRLDGMKMFQTNLP